MRRYVEPFAGSACLFFALRPARAVLGDINRNLIDAYRVISEHPRLVARTLDAIPNNKRTYYRLRSTSPDTLSPVERTARFAYLNRYCFNGVYRENREGLFNVPRGTKTGHIPSEADFVRCSNTLKRAHLLAAPYTKCLADVHAGDFVYVDPPYATKRRNAYGEYGYGCFRESDLSELLRRLRCIDDAGATFLLSYCVHPALDKIPARWHKAVVTVRRHVAGFTTKRCLVKELLISNHAPDRAHEL